MTNDTEYLFEYILTFGEMSVQVLWPFFNWVICLFITELYIALIFNLLVDLVSNEKLYAYNFIVYTFSLIQITSLSARKDLETTTSKAKKRKCDMSF